MKQYNRHDRRPRPHALLPREHYAYKERSHSWKPKMAFDNEASARNFLYSRYRNPELCSVYECPICHKWHISTLPQGSAESKE